MSSTAHPDRLVSLGPGVLGACLAFVSLGALHATSGGLTTYLALGTGSAAVAMVSLAFWLRGRPLKDDGLPGHAAHAVLSVCLVVTALDALLWQRLTGDLTRTADLMLVVAGSGAVLLRRTWFLATVALTAGVWGAAVATGPGSLTAFGIATLLAAVLCAVPVRRSRMAAVREVAALRARAAHAAVDEVTGYPNLFGLELAGAHLVAIARRESGAVGCTFVGIEGLDALQTDAAAAQAVVRFTAEALRTSVRATDVVGVWSPDQLVVVSHGAGAPMDVLRERLERKLALCPVPHERWGRGVALGRSVLEPWDEGGLGTLLAAAEADIYRHMGVEPPAASAAALAEAEAAAAARAVAAAGQNSSEVVASAWMAVDASAVPAEVMAAAPEGGVLQAGVEGLRAMFHRDAGHRPPPPPPTD